MRTDLTSNFVAKTEASSRAPIQLLAFHFASGTIWLADRAHEVQPGVDALPIIESWGELTTVGEGETSGNTRQQTLTIWNGGQIPFSEYFVVENPLNIFVDLYQTYDGLAIADAAIIDSFVVQEPITYAEVSRLMNLDLVTVNMRYDAQVGTLVTTDEYPTAHNDAINEGIPLIVGTPGEVPTLYTRAPISCTMKGSILKRAPVTILTYEDLDELGFPAAGSIEISGEVMTYSSRTSGSFYVTARGAVSSLVTEHQDGAIIDEYITDHTFAIGQGPLTSVGAVRASGQLIDPGDYTLDLTSDPATIQFPKIPLVTVYAKGTTNYDSEFDASTGANGAAFPQYAYDTNNKAFGAVVTRTLTPLAIEQVDLEEDVGEIVKLFLSIEHWASKFYYNDRVDVWVEGIGTVGTLSRPSDKDDFTYDAAVDLTHGHDHLSGGTHAHDKLQPDFDISDLGHLHGLQAGYEFGMVGTPYSEYQSIYSQTNSLSQTFTEYFNFSEPSGRQHVHSSTASITVKHVQNYSGANWVDYVKVEARRQNSSGTYYTVAEIEDNVGSAGVGLNQTYSLIVPGWNYSSYQPGVSLKVTVRLRNGDFGGCASRIENPTWVMNIAVDETDEEDSNTSAYRSLDLDIYNQGTDTLNKGIKDIADVQLLPPLSWAAVQSSAQANPTRTVTDKFELTQYLSSIDWTWLQGREIRLIYQGSSDDVEVIATWVYFQTEYLKRSLEKSTAITCEPVGSIESRPDAVVQYLLHDVAGLPLENMGSVGILPPDVWDDADTWDDTEVWVDEGEGEAGTPPAGAEFERAAIFYDSKGYTIDGVIDAELTAREAISEVCKQARARLTWESGEAKLAIQREIEPGLFVKQLDQDDLQLRSIAADLGSVQQIANDITLKYKLDHTGDQGFNALVKVKDDDSINKHGSKSFEDFFDFHLVRNDAMAADVADFYLWKYGLPETTYNFSLYLDNFDLEKNDAITLTAASTWDKISKLPLVIKDVTRVFGSGKTKLMNQLMVSAVSTRTIKHFERAADDLNLDETITITTGFDLSFVDTFTPTEQVTLVTGLNFEDTATMSESFSTLANYTLTNSDTISPSDVLSTVEGMTFEEDMGINDGTVFVEITAGFGIIPFGEENFGSSQSQVTTLGDSLTITDTVEVVIT